MIYCSLNSLQRLQGMGLARQFSLQEIEALEAKGRQIKGRREYRRLQSVLLGAKENKTPETIAKELGLHPRTIYKHQQRYLAEGFSAFEQGVPGPKGPRLLKTEEEMKLFASFKEEASQGQLLNVVKIKACFEETLGKPCATSTIYLAIHRNNWSKKQPRPRHPQGDEEAKCLFKKTI
jgi:transposase